MPNNNIIPAQNIREFLKYCSFDSVVLLDLDNTVFEPNQELGSDQWFRSLLIYSKDIQLPPYEASELILSIYYEIQMQAKMQIVEPVAIKIIKALQDIGIPVIAITSRSTCLADVTVKQLKDLGIDFSRQWKENHFDFPKWKNRSLWFYKGMLMCEGRDKGDCLLHFFSWLKKYPKNITMIDDGKKNLEVAEQAVLSYGGKFKGIFYTFLEEKTKQINMSKAAQQLLEICHLFSDQAKTAIQKLLIRENYLSADETDNYQSNLSFRP